MEIIKKNFSVLVAFIIAVVAGLLIYFAVSSQTSTNPVVVAKSSIMVGQTIYSEDLEIKQFPASATPPGSYYSINEVVGETVINGPIIAGNLVRSENIADMSALRASLNTFALEPGWTAVELPSGAAIGMSALRRGDRVDILAEVDDPEEGTIVGIICQDAIVLDKPYPEGLDQFIVAVPKEIAPKVAELVIYGNPMTLTLNNME